MLAAGSGLRTVLLVEPLAALAPPQLPAGCARLLGPVALLEGRVKAARLLPWSSVSGDPPPRSVMRILLGALQAEEARGMLVVLHVLQLKRPEGPARLRLASSSRSRLGGLVSKLDNAPRMLAVPSTARPLLIKMPVEIR